MLMSLRAACVLMTLTLTSIGLRRSVFGAAAVSHKWKRPCVASSAVQLLFPTRAYLQYVWKDHVRFGTKEVLLSAVWWSLS